MNFKDFALAAYKKALKNQHLIADFLPSKKTQVELIAQEDLVLSGRLAFLQCLEIQCPDFEIKWYFNDGDLVLKKQTVALINAPLHQILNAESTALQFLGHFSGISTLSRCYVEKLKNTSCQVVSGPIRPSAMSEHESLALQHGGIKKQYPREDEGLYLTANKTQFLTNDPKTLSALKDKSQQPLTVEVDSLPLLEKIVELKVADSIIIKGPNITELTDTLDRLPKSVETYIQCSLDDEQHIQLSAQSSVHFISLPALNLSAPLANFKLSYH